MTTIAPPTTGAPPARAYTVRSTTGTAPITFTRSAPGLLRVDLADGSSQVYRAADMALAVLGAGLGLDVEALGGDR